MNSKISPLLSRFSRLGWLFFPPLVVFSGVFTFYFSNQNLVSSWVSDLEWLSYVGLAVAAVIAWQFGCSRLVYACILVFITSVHPSMPLSAELIDSQFGLVLFGFLYLLYSKDKGFSFVNVFYSLGIFIVLFLGAWRLLPYAESFSHNLLTNIQASLFHFSADLLTFVTPFQVVLFLAVSVAGLIRLTLKVDNTHNALFIAFVTSIFMLLLDSPVFCLIGTLLLVALFCFSVIKDSFTMAFKDELTGIPSRRALMQYVNTLGRKYTVVMSDIDHFKKFNDTYGHDVGDEVLKLVASKLAKVMGGGKTFRFGGEEFIMVFPRKEASEVVPFVEVCRQVIADYDIALRSKPRPPKPKKSPTKKPTKDKIVKVTSSFGIAQRTSTHTEFSDIMKQADIALYAAKKAGRNCTKVAKQ